MATPRKDYEAALKQAEAELANHQERGVALQAAVDALRELLAAAPAPARRKPARRKATRRKPAKRKAAKPRAAKSRAAAKPKAKATVMRKTRKSPSAGLPQVAADHYKGLGPTTAYDKFVAEFGDGYSVPQIRDTLMSGGVNSKSATSLATGIYSVRRRRGIGTKPARKTKASAASKGKAAS